jgi:cyclohexadienyl dehydratase
MNRRHLPAAAAVAALAIPAQAQAQAAAGGKLAAIQAAGRIRFATTGDFNPLSFRDPATRAYRGHQIEAAEQLARDMNLRAEFVAAEWRTLVTGLQADQYDVVFAGTSMSVPRALGAAFTIPWGRTGFLPLVRRRDVARFPTWESLNHRGVTIGVNLGTTMETWTVGALPNATLRRVESPARDWQELLGGRVDATMSSSLETAFLTREHPDLVAILTAEPRNPIPLAFMSPLNDTVFKNFLDSWVQIRLASGFFAELNAKWGLV